MKRLTVLVIVASLAIADADEPLHRIMSPFERSLAERLDGTTEWRMDNGDTLQIATIDGGVARLVSPKGPILEISPPEHVEQVVSSRSASCLLLRVWVARGTLGSNYSRLVRVSRDEQSRWTAETLLPHDAPPMNERRRRWVLELGAISDSGGKALLKVGEDEQDAPPPRRVRYTWQTWLLEPPNKIADGIRVSDDFDR